MRKSHAYRDTHAKGAAGTPHACRGGLELSAVPPAAPQLLAISLGGERPPALRSSGELSSLST